jgi:hypothetical protein
MADGKNTPIFETVSDPSGASWQLYDQTQGIVVRGPFTGDSNGDFIDPRIQPRDQLVASIDGAGSISYSN